MSTIPANVIPYHQKRLEVIHTVDTTSELVRHFHQATGLLSYRVRKVFILTANTPSKTLANKNRKKFTCSDAGHSIVRMADNSVATPNEVAPPNWLTTGPPKNAKSRPSENELKTYPFSTGLQS